MAATPYNPQSPISNLPNALPRWRGFNLLHLFYGRGGHDPAEDDFRWTADWGFDFVRIPMNYRFWVEGDDVRKVREDVLKKVDDTVELGRRYHLHVNLNFHAAPGYCISPERRKAEPFSLWKDQAGLDAFCWHWQLFAKRYKGIPSSQLSFDLVNEPPPVGPEMAREDYVRVVTAAVKTIRAIDPGRLIIADGINVGDDPLPELASLGIGQSCRGYRPKGVSHYNAHWEPGVVWKQPQWPGGDHYGETWDLECLRQAYEPWAALVRQGVGVHCGECGCLNLTPHPIALAWLRDMFTILTGHGIGWGLWNLRGAFGVLDSQRSDVDYEDFQGHKLDRKLLELLQGF
jgi:endoglucanase